MEFDEIIRGGEAFLEEAKLLEVQEGLRLEFKVAAGSKEQAIFKADGKFGADGRRVIGKALSAFSNSAGGVVVIGVDCRRNAEGMDCIGELMPFAGWKTAIGTLNGSLGEMLQPRHEAIRVDGFPSAANPENGYVVIDVPRSERRPHMCQATKQYFKRTGSSSYAMEHYDIEDAFQRVSTPVLDLLAPSFKRSVRSGLKATFRLELWLRNTGIASAQAPAISVTAGRYFKFSDVRSESPVRRSRLDEGVVSLHTGSDFLIHPGDMRQLDAMIVEIEFSSNYEIERVADLAVEDAHFEVPYWISALNMQQVAGILTFSPNDFIALEDKLR